MSDWTAESLAHRIYDVGLMDQAQLEAAWSELGTRDATLDEFTSHLIRQGHITSLQLDRLLSGERLGYFYGKYKLLYLVGKGTFARVYRAVHTESGDVVALKVLRATKARDMTETEKFLREGNMVKQLRHPNIVPVQEVGTERTRPYMVMEFVEGDNLRDFLKVRKKFTVEESLKLMTDIMTGLEFALTKNVTHRDLKVSNVLVTSTGRAKLADFGLAAIAEIEKEKEKKGAQTMSQRSIDYALLERVCGVRNGDPTSDIYFAGCIMYHLLTGEPPLSDTRDRAKRQDVSRLREVKPITDLDPELPAPVVAIVQKAMELDVEKRYGTASEMVSDLRRVQEVQSGDVDEAKKIDREGEGRSVMVVESNIEMQDTLRDLLKRRGYRVLIVGDIERAMARFDDSSEKPAECVIFCTTEMGRDALDAYNNFGENEDTQHVPAVLFLAEQDAQLASQAKTSEHRVIISMPLKVRQLRTALIKLLLQHSPAQ